MSNGTAHNARANRSQSLTGEILPRLELIALSELSDGRKRQRFQTFILFLKGVFGLGSLCGATGSTAYNYISL
jgi:hypothetical protein